MKGRDGKPAPSTDLLVCFPSRAHLALMPKPICSPSRPSERHPTHHRKKSISRLGGGVANASPLYKNKQLSNEIAEPTSPRITCAGQIKVGPKTSSWMDGVAWVQERDIVSDDEDEDEEEEEEEDDQFVQPNSSNQITNDGDGDEDSKTVFSKWFMVLQENQNEKIDDKEIRDCDSRDFDQPAIPPPNALLLMRCRSAPAKSWLENKEKEAEAEAEEDEEEIEDKKENRKNLRALMDEEKMNKKIDDEDDERLVVMRYDTDFYKISSDIAKETWIVNGTQDLFSRSRSWKR